VLVKTAACCSPVIHTMVPCSGGGDRVRLLLGGIFLSYRRQDAAPYARLLKYQLSERFPDMQVFMDLDSIQAGLDFAEVITEAVDSCAVLVALIGRQWVTLADKDGRRRIDDPDDLVRFEVQAALERGVRVIPVLVDAAEPLRRQQLPAELHKLARLNALEWSSRRYQYDADQLLDLIQKVLAPIREREEADRQAREEAHRKAQEEEAERLAQEATDRRAREMGPAVSQPKLLRRDSDRLDGAQARADKATTTLRISQETLLTRRHE